MQTKKDEKDYDCFFYLGSAQEKKGTFKYKTVDDLLQKDLGLMGVLSICRKMKE